MATQLAVRPVERAYMVMVSAVRPAERTDMASADMATYMLELLTVFEKGLADETAQYDLTPVEFTLLRICLEEGEITATRLAQMLPVDASRISRIVSRLVDDELMTRRRLREDRRVVMLRLTDAGRELISRLRRQVQDFDAKLSEGISEEDLRIFSSVAARMLANHADMEQPD